MFEIKRDDLLPELTATLEAGGGTLSPVDLTGASSVKFLMTSSDGGKVINAAASFVDAAEGRVKYTWVAGDTDTADLYRAEFQVTWNDGRKQTFPNDDHLSVRVVEDLGD